MVGSHANRLSSRDEYFGPGLRGVRGCRHAGVRVNLQGDDSVRGGEGLGVAILAVIERTLHKLGPDGQRGMGAFEIEHAVIVEADPHDAQELGGEAGEPAVMRGSGFAGGRNGEAARAHISRRPGAHHLLKHADHQVVDARDRGRSSTRACCGKSNRRSARALRSGRRG